MKTQTIRYVIERSFVVACSSILIIMIVAAISFNHNHFQAIRQSSLNEIHDMLSHLLIPELSISNTVEVKRLLKLASTDGKIFSIIDVHGNIFIPDYTKIKLLKMIFHPDFIENSCEELHDIYKHVNGDKYLVNCTSLYDDSLGGHNQNLGALISFSQQRWSYFSSLMAYFALVGFMILLLLFMWFRSILQKKLLKPLLVLENVISQSTNAENSGVFFEKMGIAPVEIITIKNAFENMMYKLQTEHKQRLEIEKKTVLLELAAHVAHDIRSPLAVMEMELANKKKDKTESNHTVLRAAIQQVRDIANNLLSRYRHVTPDQEPQEVIQDDGNHHCSLLFYNLLEGSVLNKIQEWCNDTIQLNLHASEMAKYFEIHAAPAKIRSILSNLFNNAYEACNGTGKIQVNLEINNHFLQLNILDHGVGIPFDSIPDVLAGKSLKHSGNGLGLSTAKKYVESLGGELSIFSKHGEGTNVMLSFPAVKECKTNIICGLEN